MLVTSDRECNRFERFHCQLSRWSWKLAGAFELSISGSIGKQWEIENEINDDVSVLFVYRLGKACSVWCVGTDTPSRTFCPWTSPPTWSSPRAGPPPPISEYNRQKQVLSRTFDSSVCGSSSAMDKEKWGIFNAHVKFSSVCWTSSKKTKYWLLARKPGFHALVRPTAPPLRVSTNVFVFFVQAENSDRLQLHHRPNQPNHMGRHAYVQLYLYHDLIVLRGPMRLNLFSSEARIRTASPSCSELRSTIDYPPLWDQTI